MNIKSIKFLVSVISLVYICLLYSCGHEPVEPSPINYVIQGARDTDPAFSPDGNYIAYAHWADTVKNYPNGVYIINKDGSNRKLVIAGSYFNSPSWSPDGQWLVFSNGHIIKCKINGDSLTVFTDLDNLDYPQFYYPKWSSDGKLIMFDKPLGASTTSLYGTTSNFDHSGSLFGLTIPTGSYPTLSPDRERLVYSKGSKSFLAGTELFLIDTLGLNDLRLTNNNRDDRAPTWSPNGQKIAWSSSIRLSIMNADGSNQKEIGNGNSPSWSINDEIVFSYANRDYSKEVLYIISPEGKNQKQITF